ncbi:MAG: NAD(P)H dehydrogenase [Bordetella sp. SCN 67-23]|nr:MAG: NAD(P)H dehydrogenase [Bordetella sp. SCN 67-23]ODU84247.1 MAG: NAD(P)H dehydrogenase [Bordetella sp. SCN 68-11]OJW94691.1 MAG: NAD(P)H dehydrogenase [Burkholderiales bacterium 67-32]
MNDMDSSSSILILVGSPRRDGNSALLARAVETGAREAGLAPRLRFLDDYIGGFLGDRTPSSEAPADRYGELFLEEFLPAAGVVFCTPIYWYGMSAQTKAFFDRSFAYYSATYPHHADVMKRMQGKRLALTLASEESYPGAGLGIVHQVQEFARYSHSAFVGYVHGAGNRRGEVARDPRDPVGAARRLGAELLRRPYTDYRIDTPRSHDVWDAAA